MNVTMKLKTAEKTASLHM